MSWTLYRHTKELMKSNDEFVSMFIIFSGLLQGCPLSGSLFVIAIDPLLHIIKIHLGGYSIAWARAFADDIGMALRQLR